MIIEDTNISFIKKDMWKAIKDFEGYYEVSTEGLVRSVDRTITRDNGKEWHYKGKVLRPSIGTNGYYGVILTRKCVKTSKEIHRLVAETFMPTSNDKLEVDHINENKLDNRLCNLRWIDHFSNASRSNKGKNRYDKHLEKNPKAKNVVGVKDGAIIETIDCAKKMVDKYGINYSTLRQQLQKNNCKINGVEYYYEVNFIKKME